MQFDILTLFPNVFEQYFNTSILKRAQKKKLIKIIIHNLRNFASDKHRTVDDKPYGGGPGMILKVEPIYKAISSILKRPKLQSTNYKIILLTPQGKQFNQKIAQRYSKLKRLILICGHYEGVDARVEKLVDEKISVGPYILTGGELPAMVIVDAVTRLIPGVIKAESLVEETDLKIKNLKLKILREYPQYTRPAILTIKDKFGRIKVLKVPKVLLSGNHQKIKEWREKLK
ncbi:MAG: tRNA (guanosine(37)-N1)-methyltransferase TrmD, partial [Patescibacteria group bacterium]|nr:tRNA (guanosine(37)-N1)-methyltransferase TrmD [Patescibacteria group bacterium]